MYDFAIILNHEVSEIILLNVRSRLHDLHFLTSVIKYKKDLIILIRQENSQLILETLSRLKIEKLKYSKNSQDKIDKSQFKYQQYFDVQKTLHPYIQENEKFSKFKYQDRHKFTKSCRKGQLDDTILEDYFQPWEREMAVYQILSNMMVDETFKRLFKDDDDGRVEFLFVLLKKKEILRDVCPLPQINKLANSQWKQFTSLIKVGRVFKALDGLVLNTCNQFGQEVAIYFHFLLFLIKKMYILVIIGMLTYILDWVFDEDVNTSPFESVYAMITIIWGSMFVGEWKKEQNKVRVMWRSKGKNFRFYEHNLNQSLIKCLSHDDHELFDQEQKLIFERSMAYSQLHLADLADKDCDLDPVTGLRTPKKTYNIYLLYLKSGLQSLPYLIVVSLFLIVSLNVRGYVLAEHTWIYSSYLSQFSDEGALFDKNSQKANFLTIVHVMFITILNEKYKVVSLQSSLMEKHDSYHAFQASLIVKRFAFEMLSGFMDFFYIGFIRFDILALKIELLSMFTFDEIRRLIFETFIPSFQKVGLNRQITKLMIGQEDKYNSQTKQILHTQLVSIYLPKYESFDDYLEVILNFGYLMFFTSAFPLAGIVIALFLIVEFLSDNYKIHNLYQKPFSLKDKGIGPWIGSMDMICILSVFCNLILFAFASDKIAEIFPSLFQDTAHHHLETDIPDQEHLLQATMKVGAGRYIAIIVIFIEHILFLSMYAIRQYINSQTDWTDTYSQRQIYKKQIRIKK